MKQLTIRFDDDLNWALRATASREDISLNQAAIRLMRKGAGIAQGEPHPNAIGNSLDHLCGTWTQTDTDQFDRDIRVFDAVDDGLWR